MKEKLAQNAPRPGGRAAARSGDGGQRYATYGNTALVAEETGYKPDDGRAPARLRVAPPPPVAVPRAPFVLLVLMLVVGGVLGILLINTKINENAFRQDKLQQQQQDLDLRQQDLEEQIANAETPGNLAAAARKQGLVPADVPAFIRLPDGRIIGVPRPAGGAPSITSQSTGGR